LRHQEQRLKECGFVNGQGAVDINFAHNYWMGQDELQRIAKLELLDEMEEWQLLAKHYCIVWGWALPGDQGANNVFKLWEDINNTFA
jgi:hypothetical protein